MNFAQHFIARFQDTSKEAYSPDAVQAARLDEILVRAGNNQLPQERHERSETAAQSCELHIDTADHSDSHKAVTRLDRSESQHSECRPTIDSPAETYVSTIKLEMLLIGKLKCFR